MNIEFAHRHYRWLVWTHQITIFGTTMFIKEPIEVGELVFLKNYVKFFKLNITNYRVGV